MDKQRASEVVKGRVKQAGQVVRGRTGIYATLAREHGEIDSLLNMLIDTDNDEVARRRDLFTRMESKLMAHSRAEDAVLYTALSTHPETRELILESRADHAEIEEILTELGAMAIDQQSWIDKVVTLQEAVELHVDEEEQELFARAEEVLSGEDTSALDEEYQARRKVEGRPI